MVINRPKVEKFEKRLIAKEKADFIKNYRIIEAMYNEAVTLGIIPMKNPLDGLEVDIKVAKVVNSVSKST